MTVQEALTKMNEIVGAAKDRLEGNGFVMSIQTFFYDAMYRSLPDEKKARYATVTLIVSKEDGKEGEEYCLSLGVAILRNNANGKRLQGDIEVFQRYVDDTVETLAEFEDKNAGFDHLTAKAEQEYEERLAQAKEQQVKNHKSTTIFNIIFVVVFILLVFFITRK
jgi:hypothetical protein